MTSSTSDNNNDHLNFYEILGVCPNAEQQEIRKAYLRLSRKVHPDNQATEDEDERKRANANFVRLKDAYDVLYDPVQRKRYDVKQRIHLAPQQQSSNSEPKWYAKSETSSNNDQNTRANYTPGFGHNGHHPFPGAESKPNPSTGTSPTGNNDSTREDHSDTRGFGFSFFASWFNRGQGQQQSSRNYEYRSSQNNADTSNSTNAKNKSSYSTSNNPYSSSSPNSSRQPEAGTSQERDSTRDQPNRNHYTSSSDRHDQSSSTSTQKQHYSTRAADKDNSQSQQPVRVFGKTLKGTDCKKCIQQGCFCHQHVHQDTSYHGTSFCKPTGNTSNGRVFGINTTNGEPCKRCQKQGAYCYQHKDQDPAAQGNKSTQKTFGLCKDGQPCKRCLKQGGYCYQHVQQAPRQR